MNRTWRQDLAWAGLILGLAVFVGLAQQWTLVRLSWQGELAARLEQMREQVRKEQFQGVKTVNLEQAYTLFQQGQALFIDARTPEEYAELHIPRALHLTLERLAESKGQAVAGLDRDREIVVYCGQVSCNSALKVAEKLQTLGFTRVAVYLGGFRAWDEAGYPADTDK